MASSSRGSKRNNICRYFASGGSCFYGDSCQFQHVLDPAQMAVAPVPAMVGAPAQRSQSAGAVVTTRHPGKEKQLAS